MASAQTTDAAHYAMSQRNATRAYYSALLDHPNVQRGLNVIRTTEGTAKKKDPYSTAFGGGTIKSLKDHPRKSYSFTQKNGKKNKTTAAGAYQFLSRTWDAVAQKLGLKDFSKKSQDIAALALIDGRNGLEALLAGDLRGFIQAVGPEWASLPTAPDAYSQPKVGWNTVKQAWDSTVINAPGPISPAAIAAAYRDPSRALDVGRLPDIAMPGRPLNMTPVKALNALAPPSRLAPAPVGQVSRSPLAAIPASLTPAPVGQVSRAPLGPPSMLGPPQTTVATRPDVPVGSLPAAPTRSLAHPVSAPKPSNLAAAPVGQVARAPISPPDMSFTPSNPSQMGTAPASPQGNFSVPDAYAEMEARRAQAFTNMPAPTVPATPLAHPVSVPKPPVEQTMPAQVLAPVLAPPKMVKDYPVTGALAPPAPPAATAYDVYSGLADSALDNTGLNTVSAMPGGGTSVTNQWGVTTGMTPGGYQTAVGSFPSLPGIKGPIGKTAAKAAIPAVGGLFGGPLGGILGAIVAGQLAKPGGLLGGPGLRTIDTMFGPIQAYQSNPSLNSFPSAPSGGIRSATFSNRSAEGMRGISPKAAADIEAGRGGLF